MIRRVTVVVCMLLVVLALSAQKRKATKIEFEKLTHDFGIIYERDGDAECTFKFVNVGKTPLVIIRASASCGCTVPTYPERPIAAGDTAELTVVYKTMGRPGEFAKNIFVYTNTKPDRTVLQIKGVVQPDNGSDESSQMKKAQLR